MALTGSNANAGSPNDYPDYTIVGGISYSKHNMGAWSTHYQADNSDGNGGTSELCIFCHTPHQGYGGGPLWNRGFPNTASYIAYGTTIGGTHVKNSDIDGSTLACLSCHDGSTSFDTFVNAPGKGNGGSNNSTATDFNWTFTEDGNTVSDKLTVATALLGTDLRNDHAVSITYIANRASLRPTSTVISTISMSTPSMTAGDGSDANSSTTITNRWAVGGYVNPNATIADLLENGKVQCTSCHDPHFNNKSWNEIESTWGSPDDNSGLFLRRIGGNSLSGVCRTCHDK